MTQLQYSGLLLEGTIGGFSSSRLQLVDRAQRKMGKCVSSCQERSRQLRKRRGHACMHLFITQTNTQFLFSSPFFTELIILCYFFLFTIVYLNFQGIYSIYFERTYVYYKARIQSYILEYVFLKNPISICC